MQIRYALSLLLLLAIGVLPGFSQIPRRSRMRFNISGVVRDDADQHRLENIRVDLKLVGGVPVQTTFTRSDGGFEFTNLRNGDYVIEIHSGDYEPFQETVELLNAPREGLSLSLVKSKGGMKSDSRASISAHQLSAPRKAQDAFGKGMNLLYGKSDFQGAIAQFQRAIKYFPTYYEAYAAEGSAYLGMGKTAPAEEAIRKSVDLSSQKYPEALLMLSSLLTGEKRFSEAVPFATKAMQLDPTSWRGPYELARAQLGLNQIDEAEKSATHARDLDPKNPSVYLVLANVHIRRNDASALLNDLNAYLKLGPTGPGAERARKVRDAVQARLEAEGQDHADAQPKSGQDANDDATKQAPSLTRDKEPSPASAPGNP